MEELSIPPTKHTRDPISTGSAEPVGTIPRIEDRPDQLAFARYANLETVMMDSYRAERLLENGETADSLFPNSTVILTTTFEDERLELWLLEREVDVAVDFGADAVIPCDLPIYRDDSRQQRFQDLRVYAENISRAVDLFSEYGIQVIPLVKGESVQERRICYDAFRREGISYVGFYCAQFFLYGPRYRDCRRQVRDIVAEFDPAGMMLIGFQSENLLPEFPPAVKAAAGFRWFWKSDLANESVAVAYQKYDLWEREVSSALRTGQTVLSSYIDQTANGGLQNGN